MYKHYKLTKGSELYDKINALLIDAALKKDENFETINKHFKILGYNGIYVGHTSAAIVPRITGLGFDNKPKGWKKYGAELKGIYVPMKNNKEAIEILDSLHTVGCAVLNALTNFPQSSVLVVRDGQTYIVHRPGVIRAKNSEDILISVPEYDHEADRIEPYSPPFDFIKIKESEFLSLQGK